MRGIRKWTEGAIERLQLEGRGKGTKEKYLPWIEATEMSSLGRSRRVQGIKVQREHHFLSDVEWNLFLLLEYSQDVVDIREQYPLDRELTVEIAASLGIRHPYYPGTHVPTVMTSDFLVTRSYEGRLVHEVFDAKREQEAEDARSIEKLQIQRAYFNGMGYRHHLVFHSSIPTLKVKNVEWARQAVPKLGELAEFTDCLSDAATTMRAEIQQYSKRSITLSQYCTDFDYRTGFPRGTGLRTARILIHSHEIATDLNNPDLPNSPLSAFRVIVPVVAATRLGAK
ncbi:TnsA endonuclease N-terminal domain-containing protein [Noviherbaspirillum aridicola]|uniref:TnsA endonuclease-like protein n=1 Tax=Noviherbaspirillum aridicola TaxID=2849687 RepID=A0ABQ4QAB1_9BURK|nr:TnsA endonuclease N-terminal domain-containing protein [Noviherbaspirillum aridicola]GIZ53916.1 hypothetical protein NCCP691_39300 [Noviherbaspirillum aridicola]